MASKISNVPDNLVPKLTAPGDPGEAPCPDPVPLGPGNYCVYGDKTAKNTMVIFGDSHAAEWTWALATIAERSGYKLVRFTMESCPVPNLVFYSDQLKGANYACQKYHALAEKRIRQMAPQILVASDAAKYLSDGARRRISPAKWSSAFRSSLVAATSPSTKLYVLGDYAYLPRAAPDCLAAHLHSVQSCSSSLADQSLSSYRTQERSVTNAVGATYVNTLPWVCSTRCSPIVGNYLVYKDLYHLSAPYTEFLSGVLAGSLALTA